MGAVVTDVATVSIQAATTFVVSVFSAVGVVDVPTVAQVHQIGIYEPVGVADVSTVVQVAANTYSINVVDAVGVADVPTVSRQSATPRSVTVNDPVSVAEDIVTNVQAALDITPNVNDPTTVTDIPTVEFESIPAFEISVVDTAGVADIPTVTTSAVADFDVTVDDPIAVADVPTVALGSAIEDLDASVVDAVGISDVPTVARQAPITPAPSVVDAIGVIDIPTVTTSAVADFDIDVNDPVTASESATVAPLLVISVVDTVGVADVSTVASQGADPITISVVDTVGVADVLTNIRLRHQVIIYEPVGVADVPTVSRQAPITPTISVVDTITVAESPTVVTEIEGVYSINTSDSVTIAEVPTVAPLLVISVNDAVAVAEVPTVTTSTVADFDIDVNDPVAVAEVPTVELSAVADFDVSVVDTIGATEVSTVVRQDPVTPVVSVVDSVAVVEDATVSVEAVVGDLDVDVNDPATVTESTSLVIYGGELNVDVNDGVTVSEDVDCKSWHMLSFESDMATVLALESDMAGDPAVFGVWDGSTYMEITSVAGLNFNSAGQDEPFSISLWVNMASTNKILIDKGYEFILRTDGSNRPQLLRIDVANGGTLSYVADTTLSTDTWYHIVATHDGLSEYSGIKFYVNGQLQNTYDGEQADYEYTVSTDNSLRFGRGSTPGYTSVYYTGYMRQILIYDREISGSEAASLYAHTLLGDELVRYDLRGDFAHQGSLQHSLAVKTITFLPATRSPLAIESDMGTLVDASVSELTFDGNDYLWAPCPSSAQFNGNWTYAVDLYIADMDQDANVGMFFCLTDFVPNTVASVLIGYDSTGVLSATFAYDGGSSQDPEVGYDATVQDGWNHITLVKVGSTVTLTCTPDGGADTTSVYILTEDITGLNGACISGWSSKFYIGSIEPTFYLMKSGDKLKNLSWDFWSFGTAYTDVAKTIVAQTGETVADIVNDGSLGSDFTQSVALQRPTWTALSSGKYKLAITSNMI